MIIYNVTTRLEPGIAEDWLQWLRDEHIPDVLATGYFTDAVILKLLDLEEEEGSTFAVQFKAATREQYDQYINKHAASVREKTMNKWGDRIVSFRSVLEVLT